MHENISWPDRQINLILCRTGSVEGRSKYRAYCMQSEDWPSPARSRLFISRNTIPTIMFESRRGSARIDVFVSRTEYWNGELNQIFSDQFHISLITRSDCKISWNSSRRDVTNLNQFSTKSWRDDDWDEWGNQDRPVCQDRSKEGIRSTETSIRTKVVEATW